MSEIINTKKSTDVLPGLLKVPVRLMGNLVLEKISRRYSEGNIVRRLLKDVQKSSSNK